MIRSKGFTLLEIMISLALGIIVIGGAMSIYISTIQSSADISKSARINYDLDSAAQLMVNDIRRAGFWGSSTAGSDAKDNPFMTGNANITISNMTGAAVNSCILYSYDGENSDGTVDVNEYYGFRLNGTGIDMRFTVANIANATCDDGSWQNIIDTNQITIGTLTFTDASLCLNNTTAVINSPSCAAATNGDETVQTREIGINIVGSVVNDATVTKNLTVTARVRNDRIRIFPAP